MKFKKALSIALIAMLALSIISTSSAMTVLNMRKTQDTLYSWQSVYDKNDETTLYNPVKDIYLNGTYEEIYEAYSILYAKLSKEVIEMFGIDEGIWEVVVDEYGELLSQGESFLYNRVLDRYRSSVVRVDETGNQIPVNLVEYAEFLNGRVFEAKLYMEDIDTYNYDNTAKASATQPITPTSATYGYVETKTSTMSQISMDKVSNGFAGPGYMNASGSASISEWFSPFDNADAASAIKSSSTITWRGTLLSNPNPGAFYVPSGKIGYIWFCADAVRTDGTLWIWVNGAWVRDGNGIGGSPIKTGNYAQGVFYCLY